MIDAAHEENLFSASDEDDELYDAFEFDPEHTFVDDEIDNDALAFRDAARDIWASEGSFELIFP